MANLFLTNWDKHGHYNQKIYNDLKLNIPETKNLPVIFLFNLYYSGHKFIFKIFNFSTY